MARCSALIWNIDFVERPYRLQHVADDVDRWRRSDVADTVDFLEQAIGEVKHIAEIAQQSVPPAVARLLDQQLAITLDRVQRCAQLVAKTGGLAFDSVRGVDRA